MSNKNGENASNCIKQWISRAKALGLTDPVFCRIITTLENGNYNKRFLLMLLRHLTTIDEYLHRLAKKDDNIKDHFTSEDDGLQYFISYFFLDKMGTFSPSNFIFDANYVEPVKRAPLEAFLKPDKVSIQSFEENLKEKDILFAEVVSTDFKDNNEEFFLLRFISKVDDPNIVYHLDIKVHLFKKCEEELLQRELQLSEILQVVMMGSISKNNVKKHYGTTNMKFAEKSADIDCLSQKQPLFDFSFFKEVSKFSSYAQYLDSMVHFNRKHDLINGMKSLGLDPYHHFSFNDGEHKLPKGFRVGASKKAAYLAQQKESNTCLEEGNTFVQNGDVLNALTAFDNALKIWPENYTVFACRGQIYADFKKHKEFFNLEKASQDFGCALKINPHSESVKIELSEICLHIAKKLITKKKYIEAKKVLQKSVNLNRGNEKATVLHQKIHKKLLAR